MREISGLRVNEARLREDFEALAEIGATASGGISRVALSYTDLVARAWFANRLDDIGVPVIDDEAGNLSGVLSADRSPAPTLVIGGHMDSVPNGGRYDSSVGIIAGLECLRVIQEAGIRLPVNLELVNFTDQAGTWHAMFGSKCFAGKFERFDANERLDTNEMSAFRAALTRAGLKPSEVHLAARDPQTLAGFLELHIEQGGRLAQAGDQIGVVTGIIGRSTYDVMFQGEAGHSGTTPPGKRRDALLGAADFITKAHEMIRQLDNGSIFNCGNITVEPGAFNVIPRTAHLTTECRHPDEATLSQLEADLEALARHCAHRHQLTVTVRRRIHMPAVSMSPQAIIAIERALHTVGVSRHSRLISFAGHHAQLLSPLVPAGMIFVPSVDGISHNPKEFTEWQDVVAGANALLHSVLNMAGVGAG